MKKISFIVISLLTVSMFTSCDPLDKKDTNVVNYSIDASKIVDQPFVSVNEKASSVTLVTNLPFKLRNDITFAEGSMTLDAADANKEILKINANGSASAKAYTRQVVVYLQNSKAELIKDFGEFFYPIVVRQSGLLGTKYISAAQLKDLKNQEILNYRWWDDLANLFIKGRITDISEAYTWEGFKQDNGLYLFPYLAAITCDRTQPYVLEAKDITIDIDGTPVKVQATWGKAYQLLSKMNVKVGDTVELGLMQYGVQKASDKDFIAIPTSIVKVDE